MHRMDAQPTTPQQQALFVEETDELSRPTGVEYEAQPPQSAPAKPYDPELIRVDPKTFSLRQVLDMIDDGDLELAPDFQRLKVWTQIQKSRLIESVLLRIPLPAFYFSSDNTGKLQVVDGLQRLSTIHDFVRGGRARDAFFPLVGLEYLQELLGDKTFTEVESPLWTRRINHTQIVAHVIDPQTPYRVKFDIFRRINTGGSPLNAQEIRHCLSEQKSRGFLKHLTGMDSFQRATNWAVYNNVRMADREVVLRFCAFRAFPGQSRYNDYETIDEFLNSATQHLDEAPEAVLERIASEFDTSMRNAYELFGRHAFRKWPLGDDRLCPFNRALFDALSVRLADYELTSLEPRAATIVASLRSLMAMSPDFIDSISASTGDIRRVRIRFAAVDQLLREIRQ